VATKGRLIAIEIDPTCAGDHRQDAFDVLIDLVVPKSNDAPTA
jgi:hypothetical protein